MRIPIDLRSDTVTRPTPAMRRAIAEAEVGDDVFGDDPTVRRLEETVAGILGKEAAIFIPSGTMSNQIAVAVHTRPGDEILLETSNHVHAFESGAPAAISGVTVHTLPGRNGLVEAETLKAALRPHSIHFPDQVLFVLENTHNRAGGRVLPLEGMVRAAEVARSAGLKVHLDGARIWNATVASGIPESRYAAVADTVSVCLSKGLGAPVGSVLASGSATIARARHVRKRLGGGMRQAGILAAAGLYALEHHRARLAEDHARAKTIARALREIPVLDVDLDQVETDIVLVNLRKGTAAEWTEALRGEGVLCGIFGPATLRVVTHLDIDDASVEKAISAFRATAGAWS
jgi:threonine aldolase